MLNVGLTGMSKICRSLFFQKKKNAGGSYTQKHIGFLSGKIQDGLHGMASWQGPILAKHGFGPDWAPYGSKWNFDRLPQQGISRRS